MNNEKDTLETTLSDYVAEYVKDLPVLSELNQPQIMKAIRLSPPFLKIQKIVIARKDDQTTIQSKSFGMGFVTMDDTRGHYSDLVSLALCGQLMASTAAIHLAVLFPKTAPQAAEVTGIKPAPGPNGKKLWVPSANGTPFVTEVTLLKRKLHIAHVAAKISFGNVRYGLIEQIKFVLIPSSELNSVSKLPSV